MDSATLKSKGDQAFKAKDFEGAVGLYKQAAAVSTDNAEKARIYSNKSAANYSILNFREALSDAKSAIEADPMFSKAYGRAANASLGLGNADDAISYYQQYLRIDPENPVAKKGLEDAIKVKNTPDNNGALDVMNEIQKDPEAMEIMSDPDFMQALMAGKVDVLSDPKYAKVMKYISRMQGMFENEGKNGSTHQEIKTDPTKEENQAFKTMNKELKEEEQTGQANAQREKIIQEKRLNDEAIQEEANEYKEQGNELYKKKKFSEAIAMYTKAFDTYKDVLFLTNIAAATLESGKPQEALTILDEAVEFAKETHASYAIMGKIYHKIANVHIKMGQSEKALTFLKKSLTEDRNPDVLNKRKKLEKEIKAAKESAYLSKDKAFEASEKGKQLFKDQQFAEAIKMFDEAIKRDPSDFKHYSNRSACLFKLLAFPDCIKDCDTVISKDPSFIKVYIRKAQCLLAMQKYAAATIVVTKGLEKSPSAAQFKDLSKVKSEITSAVDRRINNGTLTRDEVIKAALAEPEVRDIVQDPVMANILEQAKSDPSVIMQHYSNPDFSKKIGLLADVGIISMR